MVLSARPLGYVNNVNDWSYQDQAEWTAGDVVTVWFQLLDATKDLPSRGFNPGYRRYVPAASSTLTATLDSVDAAVKLTRTPVQAFPTSDPSIWSLSVLAADKIAGTCALVLQLTEPGGKVTNARVEQFAAIHRLGCP